MSGLLDADAPKLTRVRAQHIVGKWFESGPASGRRVLPQMENRLEANDACSSDSLLTKER